MKYAQETMDAFDKAQMLIAIATEIESPALFWSAIATTCDCYATKNGYGMEFVMDGLNHLIKTVPVVWAEMGDDGCHMADR